MTTIAKEQGMPLALSRFARHRLATAASMAIMLLVLGCIVGPHLLPYNDLTIDFQARLVPPLTGWHLLGTDALGRDVAARLLIAGRVSLTVAFASMLMSIFFGTMIGLVAGYIGGRLGAALMRFVDASLSFPSLFLLLTLAAFVQPSPLMITVLIAAASWMEIARIVDAEVKSLRQRDFILAARMLALPAHWILWRELLPNVIGPVIVAATLTVARSILAEAYISFLGYGIQPPFPSWGNMLNGAQEYLTQAPWLAIVPGITITIAVTCFNFVGDGLRDAFDNRREQ